MEEPGRSGVVISSRGEDLLKRRDNGHAGTFPKRQGPGIRGCLRAETQGEGMRGRVGAGAPWAAGGVGIRALCNGFVRKPHFLACLTALLLQEHCAEELGGRGDGMPAACC